MKKNDSVDPMNLAGLAVLAVGKIIGALVLAGIGLGIFGWGLIGCAYVFTGIQTSVVEFFGLMLFTIPMYVCLAGAICLVLSIFLKKQIVFAAARWLTALYLILTAVFLVDAYSKANMVRSPVGLLAVIFYVILVIFLVFLLVFFAKVFPKNNINHTS